MPERQRMTTRLKTLFQRSALFVLAGGINPIGAKMAEALGYDAFYMSGGNTSAHQLGWPRLGDQYARHGGQRPENCPGRADPGLRGCRHRLRQEMVGKLRAAMDAKQALDPDFVITARCDLGGVPGAGFAEIIERCQAYKAQVDVICPNGLRTWEEIQEAIRVIPGPVVPLIPAHLSPYPSLQAQQDAGAAAAWFPALTTMAGLQANWDFLSDFQQRGTLALDALRAQAAQSPWGVASNGRILDEPRLRSMEEMYLPK
jgi:2-methylisocitrate lyase-like PEP mutase family enzyme